MHEIFSRSTMLLGEENMQKLARARVAVFGLGGVGGCVVEGLARGGVGSLDLIDADAVSASNINRQILALSSTLGQPKCEVAKERARQINPEICVTTHNIFFDSTTAPMFDFKNYDYVVDAVDTVTAKLLLAESCKNAGVPIISCMGTGNKLSAESFKVSDISKTTVCPLARVMRRELKKRGIESLKVVYSEEQPMSGCLEEDGRHAPGSVSFVPPVAGFIAAGEVIKDLIKK